MASEAVEQGSPAVLFRHFIESGEHLLGRTSNGALTELFLAFVADADPIRRTAVVPLSQPSAVRRSAQEVTVDFRAYIDTATEIVVRQVMGVLPVLRPRICLARRWLVRHDLLAIAGLTFVENAYTELMAWALDPRTDPDSAAARQRAWLDSVGLGRCEFAVPAEPRTQVRTDDGIPDLLLVYETFAVVVEAKTGTSEHATPSGLPQTLAYSQSVRPWAKGDIHVIFITPDWASAANQSAALTTFVDFAMTMARLLDGVSLDPEARFSFALLVTHFLTCGVKSRRSVRELIVGLADWLTVVERPDSSEAMARMPELLSVLHVFGME